MPDGEHADCPQKQSGWSSTPQTRQWSVGATLVIAESESESGVTAERILQELTMTIWAQVVTPMVTLFTAFVADSIARDVFEHLMQFMQLIDVVVDTVATWFLNRRLNVDLNNVASLVRRIDLAFTAVAGVVDHLSRIRLRVILTARPATKHDPNNG